MKYEITLENLQDNFLTLRRSSVDQVCVIN